jgi:hypothetical protein
MAMSMNIHWLTLASLLVASKALDDIYAIYAMLCVIYVFLIIISFLFFF